MAQLLVYALPAASRVLEVGVFTGVATLGLALAVTAAHSQRGLSAEPTARCPPPQHGLSSKTMTLITSDCGATRSLSIRWP